MILRIIFISAFAMIQPSGGIAQTQRPVELFGEWGSPAQCTRQLILPGGSLRHSPVSISADWFAQNGIWCRLDWSAPRRRDGRLYVVSRARCGEDTVRPYWLAFDLDLRGDAPQLSLIWDEVLVNGPMQRCDKRAPGS